MAAHLHGKANLGKGIGSSTDANQLDVFGSSYDELTFSSDVWWGITAWKWGVAQSITVSNSKNIQGFKVQPGALLQTTLTGGRDYSAKGKIIAGFILEHKLENQIDDIDQSGSGYRNLTLFTSMDYKIHDTLSLRGTINGRGFGSTNQYSYSATSLTLAIQQILI